MGVIVRDPMSVVDAKLLVHGIDVMRIIDCSMMPTVPSGNTNIPILMVAEKASSMILADAGA